VGVLDAVGPKRLATRLSATGAGLAQGQNPGLAIGLGGIGIRLVDLTMLYAALARLGTATAVFERRDLGSGLRRRPLDPVAAWYVGKILLGTPPPENAWAGGSLSKRARATVIAMPGRPDSTVERPWGLGPAGQTARRPRGSSGAMPQPRSCSRHSPARPAGLLRCRPPPPGHANRVDRTTSTAPAAVFGWPGPGVRHGDPLRILFPPDGVTFGMPPGQVRVRLRRGPAVALHR